MTHMYRNFHGAEEVVLQELLSSGVALVHHVTWSDGMSCILQHPS